MNFLYIGRFCPGGEKREKKKKRILFEKHRLFVSIGNLEHGKNFLKYNTLTLFSSHSSKEAKEGEEGKEKITGSPGIWDKASWASRTNTKTGSFYG